MTLYKNIFIIIPARNEAESLKDLLPSIKKSGFHNIVVVDNGSTDNTFQISKEYTEFVIKEQKLGYGNACLAGISFINSFPIKPEIVCFFDGDGQSLVSDIHRVTKPVVLGFVSYCQGTRITSKSELKGSAYVANKVFAKLITLFWGEKITDLGPLRCMSLDVLNSINMKTNGYAWTIEMNSKISKSKIDQTEIIVGYKKRETGKSKISGNVSTSLKAAIEMTLMLFKVSIFWKLKI